MSNHENTKVFGEYFLIAFMGKCMRGRNCSMGKRVLIILMTIPLSHIYYQVSFCSQKYQLMS